MPRVKEDRLFDFPAMGMAEPVVAHTSFSRKFPHLKDHRRTEALYHPGEKTTYLNSEMPSAEPDIAENHERIHHFQRSLGEKSPAQYSKFISTVASLIPPDSIKKIGLYAQGGRDGKMTADEVYSEILPHLYSLSKSPHHRENFKTQTGATDGELAHVASAWDTVAGSLGLGLKKSDDRVEIIKQKLGDRKAKTFKQKVKEVKAKYVAPKAKTFDEEVEAVKQKYLTKSAPMAQVRHQQPTSEQFLAAAAQQLGLPVDDAEAEALAKAKERQWEDSISGWFRDIQKPVENTTDTSVGRGRVDHNDESILSEEEKRIRAIPVDPNLLKV